MTHARVLLVRRDIMWLPLLDQTGRFSVIEIHLDHAPIEHKYGVFDTDAVEP